MVTTNVPYTRVVWSEDFAWNVIIQEVNYLATHPNDGCGPLNTLEEVDENHIWSKTDVTDVQDKLKEICDSNEFTELLTNQLWTSTIIDEIKEAINQGWCNCSDVFQVFQNTWVHGTPGPEGFSLSFNVSVFITDVWPLFECAAIPRETVGAPGIVFLPSPLYITIDTSANNGKVIDAHEAYDSTHALVSVWEENRILSKYWDNQASIAETEAEREAAEAQRDHFQEIADTTALEMDGYALTNASKLRALLGRTNEPNLMYEIYTQRSIGAAFEYGNAQAIIMSPWDTGLAAGQHTRSTFKVELYHSDEGERYERFEGKCTPSGLPYVDAAIGGFEFEKIILFAAGKFFWGDTYATWRDPPCNGHLTRQGASSEPGEIIITDMYLLVTHGSIA